VALSIIHVVDSARVRAFPILMEDRGSKYSSRPCWVIPIPMTRIPVIHTTNDESNHKLV
jgi:hypothetical protein